MQSDARTHVAAPAAAIIIAGGKGERLRPLTNTRPTCPVEVAGRAILDWQLASLERAGVERVAIIGHYLVVGRAKVVWEREPDAELLETELEPGAGYSCEAGQKHRLVGITPCDIIEVSTPDVGTTLRLEDDYRRGGESLGGAV